MPDHVVTRAMRYAWIEYGHSGDGQAFDAKLKDLGWRNLFLDLPRATDSGGARRVDASHPTFPIRFKGNALMGLPNDIKDHSDDVPVPEPLYTAFRSANGPEAFAQEMTKQAEFLARFVINPGVRKVSATEGHLTDGTDATDHADLVAISGHGSSGVIWGGNYSSGTKLGDEVAASGELRHASRLKYVLIPTCYNLSQYQVEGWFPLLRASVPIHGVLGFSQAYPGGDTGGLVFGTFGEKLKARGMTIIKAFRDANAAHGIKDRWGAFMHESAFGDTMSDWMAGTLKAPSPSGKIVWLNEDNYPAGVEVKETPPRFLAQHVMEDGRKVEPGNRNQSEIGLFPGKKGKLELSRNGDAFKVGDTLKVTFYYFRPNKDGMDLPKLLVFEPHGDADFALVKDDNKEDGSAFEDAIQVTVKKAGPLITLPYRVHPLATDTYHRDGDDAHGMFWHRVQPTSVADTWDTSAVPLYRYGAWLRPRRD
jgi:hypothetical protein